MRRDIYFSQRGNIYRAKIIGHQIVLEGELKNKVGMLMNLCLEYYTKIAMFCKKILYPGIQKRRMTEMILA